MVLYIKIIKDSKNYTVKGIMVIYQRVKVIKEFQY